MDRGLAVSESPNKTLNPARNSPASFTWSGVVLVCARLLPAIYLGRSQSLSHTGLGGEAGPRPVTQQSSITSQPD